MNQESVAVLMRAAAPVIAGFVAQEVAKATAPLITRIDELENRPAPERGEKGDKGDDGNPGESVSTYEIELLVAAEVAEAVAAMAPPKDGEPGKDAPPPTDEQVAKAVAEYLKDNPPAPGVKGGDGVGLAGALIDRDGVLHLTMTDGTSHALGVVVGKDGAPGDRGQDGRDGFSPEDFTAELKEDGRTLVLKLARGENEIAAEIVLPVVLDRGVWKEGQFQKGDGVTWGGSFFIAQCDTNEKPEQSKDWRLAVKRGRDGKNGSDGEQGKQGPQGLPGKDWQGNRG